MSRIPDFEPLFDDENPEWTEEEFARAQPASELPPHFLRAFPKTAEALAHQRVEVTLKLGQDVLSYYRSRSDDWEAEIDAVLRRSIKR